MTKSLCLFPSVMVLAAVTGCGGNNQLFPAFNANVETEATMLALSGTPVTAPSGFSIIGQRATRLDLATSVDFIFDIDDQDRPFFLPARAAGFPDVRLNAGLKLMSVPFDSIDLADTDGYTTLEPVFVQVGEVYLARTGLDINTCILSLPLYMKLEVREVDLAARSIRLRVLANTNCGFRSLLTGLPTR